MASIDQPAAERRSPVAQEPTPSASQLTLPPGQEASSPEGNSGVRPEWEAFFATAMSENNAWLAEHETALLQAHPDWLGKDVVIASRTPSKILAVADDRQTALALGLKSCELLEVARQQQVPPGILLTAAVLGDAY